MSRPPDLSLKHSTACAVSQTGFQVTLEHRLILKTLFECFFLRSLNKFRVSLKIQVTEGLRRGFQQMQRSFFPSCPNSVFQCDLLLFMKALFLLYLHSDIMSFSKG